MKATQEHINRILDEHFVHGHGPQNARSMMHDLLDFIPIPDDLIDIKLVEGPELEMMVQAWLNARRV